MYKVRDNTISNRTVTMADGGTITFANHFADVPDRYVEYFRRISDFQVQTHTDDTGVQTPVVEESVVEAETPAEEVKAESEVEATQEADDAEVVAEETPEVQEKTASEEVDTRADFQKADE